MSGTVAQLRAALRLAEIVEENERQAVRDRIKPKHSFSIKPVVVQRHTGFHDRILDPTIRIYTLTGVITNLQECEAAGHQFLRNGSMSYLFNTGTGKIVMAHGSGTLYIDESDTETWKRLNKFISENPNGGDITDLMKHRKNR